eukprot:11159833-Ditylum_brightwellii.AAC.1
MTRAAMKAGEFKDAEMEDDKTAPSPGKCKSDNQDECIKSGIGGSLDPVQIKTRNHQEFWYLLLPVLRQKQ